MKELDCVEVIVEKDKYARDGVHKGMNGWICDPRCIDGYWLVNFPQYGEKENIATLEIKEDDLLLIPVMQAIVNEQIKMRRKLGTIAMVFSKAVSTFLIIWFDRSFVK